MFCNQCQETLNNKGCTMRGVCGKTDEVADLQDLLIHMLRGVSYFQIRLREKGIPMKRGDEIVMEYLFSTITNTNFDRERIIEYIREAQEVRDRMKEKLNGSSEKVETTLPDYASWEYSSPEDALQKAKSVGHLAIEDEDMRALSLTLLYGLKGISAYLHHAYMLGKSDGEIFDFINRALVSTWEQTLSVEEKVNRIMECGEYGIRTMSLLDDANTSHYGVPVPHEVNLGVKKNPGILISGHDLKDLEELLEQTKDTGIDVYTHGEMLPANYYPYFEKYDNLVGNYGGSWWKQILDFDTFNGPILLTTNCLVPPRDSYRERVYTTSIVGFDGLKHIPDRKNGRSKDFSELIEHAKRCDPPKEIEAGKIVGGFNHRTLWELKDKVIDAVKQGKISKFYVMAGCDGRHKSREYYTDFAKNLPEDAVILTAGCAKYRYNKIIRDDIEGIPRVIDAGQCNDSYSLALFALKLAEELGVDVNDLPIEYNVAWYEQKAVLVLLSLLKLGVKNIHLGPTLPGFMSENVLNMISEKFDLKPTTTVEEDIAGMTA